MADAPEAGLQFQVPEHLWDDLVEKIENGAIGSDGYVQAVLNADGTGMLVAEADMDMGPAGGHIFIVPNLHAATRPQLHQRLEHDGDALQACATAIQLSEGAVRAYARDQVLREVWAWARPTQLTGTPARAQIMWTLESPESLWARHAEIPNMAVVPLPAGLAAEIGDGEGAPQGAVMMWPLRQIKRGEEVTRDQLPGTRSLQRGAALLALLGEPPRRWAHAEEYEGLKTAVEQAVASQPPPGVLQPPGRTVPSDQRLPPPHQPGAEVLSVWTDYPLVRENLTDERFTFTDDRGAADIVFSVRPVRDFLSMPSGQLVNQFPYEGCIIRKDLLPATLRRLHAAALEADPQQEEATPQDAPASSWFPQWFPPAFDLATEVQYFLRDYAEREAAGRDTHYVVKLAEGSRSTNLCLTASQQLVVRAREAPGGDRIAQKYVEDPLLFRGRKFDLRMYLVVRSFAEGDAFLYSQWYGRLANKAYPSPDDMARTETDAESHFTVAAYDADPAVSSAQVMVAKSEVVAELQSQGIDTAALDDSLRHVAQQVVQAAQAQIGHWPRSRAVYGLDILLARSGAGRKACSPQLLEVNFCPDFTSWLRFQANVKDVINDIFAAVFTQLPEPPGFWQLCPEPHEQPALQLSDVDNID